MRSKFHWPPHFGWHSFALDGNNINHTICHVPTKCELQKPGDVRTTVRLVPGGEQYLSSRIVLPTVESGEPGPEGRSGASGGRTPTMQPGGVPRSRPPGRPAAATRHATCRYRERVRLSTAPTTVRPIRGRPRARRRPLSGTHRLIGSNRQTAAVSLGEGEGKGWGHRPGGYGNNPEPVGNYYRRRIKPGKLAEIETNTVNRQWHSHGSRTWTDRFIESQALVFGLATVVWT